MRNIVCGVILGGLLTGLCACTSDRTPTVSAATPASAAVLPASDRSKPSDYVTSGPLVVERQVDIGIQRAGVVASLTADVGQSVRKGQVLAELDGRQLQADHDAAEARVRADQFYVQHWQAEIKIRQTDLDRDEQLFKDGLITQQKLDHSRYDVKGVTYEADRNGENLKNDQETLRSLQLELDKTKITAPFDGVIARRYIRLGQQVAVNDRAFWLTEMSPLNVKFTVPQEFAGKLKIGDPVSVISDADPAHPETAKLTRISPVVDPSSGTIEVQAQLEGHHPALIPGMTVNVHVPQR